jgi:zinc transport system substrate-binding protein
MRRAAAFFIPLLIAAPAAAEVPKVITDVPPVHSLVAQVMGDLGAPELLAGSGTDAHSLQLRPSQAAALGAAQLVFWIGPEMTPWMDRALEADFAGRAVALLDAGGTRRRAYEEESRDGDHADEAHEEASHAEGEAHRHEGTDPHAWLDPGNALVWLDLIAAELAAADPEHAATYAANRDAAGAAIAAMDAEIAATLAGAGSAPFVVGHDAYGYFADHYGLTIAAALAESDAAEPGAAHLSEVAAMLAEKKVACVFPEAGHDMKRANMLVEGTAARLGPPLDPEGKTLEPGPGLYGALMRGLAGSIAACLGSS